MDKTDKHELYGDAIYWHLISKGYTEYQAKVEARRIIDRLRESNIAL